jgi:hypothetical protein
MFARTPVQFKHCGGRFLGAIPISIFMPFRDALREAGVIWLGIPRDRFFSNCSREIIASAPPMEFIFPDSGILIYYPEQYMQLLHNGQCVFLFNLVLTTLSIDPLMLRGMNIRISHNRIWDICEASDL